MAVYTEASLLRNIDETLQDVVINTGNSEVVITGGTVGISGTVEVSGTTNVGNSSTVAAAIGAANTTALATSVLTDAFGRQRVSEPNTLFDTKYLYDAQPLLWDDAQASGSGTTSTYVQAMADVTLAVSANTAGRRVRQTKQRFNYQSGKSFQIFRTAVLGAAGTGLTKRIGYYDDSNGVFFQVTGGVLSVGVRTGTSGSPVDGLVAQSAWNVDKMNGTGASGITLDITKSQIFYFEFEWLGVGAVRFGVVIDRILYIVHQVNNANVLAMVYMSTPNLPCRTEIINTGAGAAASLDEICTTVISEGGFNPAGLVFYQSRGGTAFTTLADADLYPVMSIRLKSTHLATTVNLLRTSIIVPSNADFEWLLVLNPTVAGADAASWVALTNSSIEYDISRTNANKLTGGTIIAGSYNSDTIDVLNSTLPNAIRLGTTIAGVRDHLVLAWRRIGTPLNVETIYGGLEWQEIS